ncbi:MAG: LysM peptidoglycan-binding domain-containing protein [Planctomycetota bacterium]|jgi:nucleoid-associated protein YgaU
MGKLIKATVLSALLLAIALYIAITTFAPGDTPAEQGEAAKKILQNEAGKMKEVAKGFVKQAPAGEGSGLADVMNGGAETKTPPETAPATPVELTVGKPAPEPEKKDGPLEGPVPGTGPQAAPQAAPEIPSQEPIPLSEPKVVEHTVEEGETLSDIALKYLGSSKNWPLIVKANPGIDKDLVRVGQKLVIPLENAGSDARVFPPRTLPENRLPEPAFRNHKVEEGETLCEIAEKYLGDRNRFMEIAKANGIDIEGANDIRPGQVLKIPGAVEER